MSEIDSGWHLITQFYKFEQWEDLKPMLNDALDGRRYSGQDLLCLSAAAIELGRNSAAQKLLGRALETGAVSRQKAGRFVLRRVQESLEKCGQYGSLGARPTRIDSPSDLTRWYRTEGKLGVYVPKLGASSPLSQIGSACSELAEKLVQCACKAPWSDTLQKLVAYSGYESLFSPEQANLLQPFSSNFDGLRVLELGCQGGTRARFLAESGANVTAVTASPEHALLTAALCADLPNVDVVLDAPHTVPFRGLFDLVEITDYQEGFVGSTEVLNPLDHLLSRAYSALSFNGTLLISGHNALALRHFNDHRDVFGREGAIALEGCETPSTPQLLPSSKIRSALLECGFYRQEHFAVMGTVGRSRLLVSPLGCDPTLEQWNLETLVRRSLMQNDEDRLARFSESRVMHTILQGGHLEEWSDGYLFLAHKCVDRQIRNDEWLASYFSFPRDGVAGHESRFQLVQGQRNSIEVVDYNSERLGGSVVRPYFPGVVHRDVLDDLLQVPGWTFEQVLQWSAVWLRCLLSSLRADDILVPVDNLVASYSKEHDFWVPDRLLGATPAQWIKSYEGEYNCLYTGSGSGATVPMAMVLYAGLIGTFSTLRSVAEPADSTWLEPVALAEEVCIRLGYVVQLSDIEGLKAHYRAVTSTNLSVPNHLLAREKPRALTDYAKLYWTTECEGFSEGKTSTANFVLDGRVQTLSLTIASPEERVTNLRLDLANRPGCFEVEEIIVIRANGDLLWRWQHSREELSGIECAALVLDPEAERSCVLARGDDPQLSLNLPKSALEAASGGFLQVRFSGWPQRL